jgi:DNA-binding CsgD family transcriptional regulator
VDLLTRACALTPREGELLRLLASGIDTRGLASRLHLSEHTVQDHLKAIFSKTATHSRRALLALAVGA